jgi:drug/metabolite transporter (DMT)-like permease
MLEVALVNYLWPVLTLTGTILLFHIKPTRWIIPGTLLTLLGLSFVVNPSFQLASFASHLTQNPIPYALAGCAALTWALYSNLSRLWTQPGDKGHIEWFMLGAALLLFGVRPLFHEHPNWSIHTATELVVLATLSGTSYWCWDQAVRNGHLKLITTISYLTPVSSTIVSSLYLAVVPQMGVFLGCLALSSGALLTWKSTQPKASSVHL